MSPDAAVAPCHFTCVACWCVFLCKTEPPPWEHELSRVEFLRLPLCWRRNFFPLRSFIMATWVRTVCHRVGRDIDSKNGLKLKKKRFLRTAPLRALPFSHVSTSPLAPAEMCFSSLSLSGGPPLNGLSGSPLSPLPQLPRSLSPVTRHPRLDMASFFAGYCYSPCICRSVIAGRPARRLQKRGLCETQREKCFEL